MKAKVARFYGWTDETINKMSFISLMDYWKAITPLEAKEALWDLEASQFVWMKKEKRRKLYESLKKQANNVERENQTPVTTRSIAMKLAGAMQGR